MIRSVVFASLALALVACGGAEDEGRPPAVATAPAPFSDPAPPPVMMEEPVEERHESRPRLSHTVTLGEEQYVPMPEPGAYAAPTPQNVTVNNTTVYNGGYGYYGGGWASGYGHGYYRGTGYANAASANVVGHGAQYASHPAWGSSGWEGAARTAAPGRTPAVGGNYAPPASAGPAQMK